MNIFSIIKYILISITFIITIHNSWLFLKNNLTVPKTKDLIEKPSEVYRNIYGTIKGQNNSEDMKNELRNYIGELKEEKNDEPLTNNKNDAYFSWDSQNINDDEQTLDLSNRF
jgi:hypothetical protein